MNQKELGEIRRHLSAERCCIGKIYGCFVNVAKEIIATTESSVALMPEDELERYLALFKKTLSGGIGRALLDIDFSTEQVANSEVHHLLAKLRSTSCSDGEARTAFFKKIIESVDLKDQNCLILLASDSYDVPWKSRDGAGDERESDTMFTYLLCAICPVAEGKTNLGYDADARDFHNCTSAQTVAAPEMGFMFPAFDGRRANIYNALYYSRNLSDIHEGFVEEFFGSRPPMSAGIQKDTFESVLTASLEDSYDFDVAQNVHEQIRARIEAHKELKEPEPPEISASDVGAILRDNEIEESKIEKFREKCTEAFGPGAVLNPGNIVDTKKFTLTMPQVKVAVTPEYSGMIETRIIDGRKYILIPADEGVEVNGIAVQIQ